MISPLEVVRERLEHLLMITLGTATEARDGQGEDRPEDV